MSRVCFFREIYSPWLGAYTWRFCIIHKVREDVSACSPECTRAFAIPEDNCRCRFALPVGKQTRCRLSRRAPEEAESSGRLFLTSALDSSRGETSSYHLSCFHVGKRGGASTNGQPAQNILQFAISENFADVGHRTTRA